MWACAARLSGGAAAAVSVKPLFKNKDHNEMQLVLQHTEVRVIDDVPRSNGDTAVPPTYPKLPVRVDKFDERRYQPLVTDLTKVRPKPPHAWRLFARHGSSSKTCCCLWQACYPRCARVSPCQTISSDRTKP